MICIKNHLSTSTFEGAPWEYTPNVPEEAKASKEAFGKWSRKGDTDHLFFCGAIGINPAVRPSKENPCYQLAAFIADYDAVVTDAEIEAIKEKLAPEIWPSYVSNTFSGGARLVWVFEKPIAAEHDPIRTALLKRVHAAFRLDKLLPGLDKDAWLDPHRTYECGTNWRAFRPEGLASYLVEQLLFEASKRLKPEELSGEGLEIPLELVFKEIERQFPGRWTGPFELGARGIVVWDDTSKNPTASIVCATGMVAFGQAKTFYSWKDILGPAFVQQFIDDKIGRTVDNIWFDGRWFWYREGRGVYANHDKTALTLKLKASGLDDKKSKGDALCEVEAAVHFIIDHHRLDRVAPLIYDPRDIVITNGKRQLNTSRVLVMQPSSEAATEWGDNGQFPNLSKLFGSWFDPVDDMNYFLAWFQRFYRSALAGRVVKGQAVFLGGPVQIGKTFLTNVILSRVFGGHALAADFLQGDSIYSKELTEVGLWCIDDAVASKDNKGLAKFSENIKSFVVNPLMTYRAMYQNPESVPWHGRIVVTLNLDEQSLKMIPVLDNSIQDKLMLLKMKAPDYKFHVEYRENEGMVDREAPHFLRWLLNWEPPAYVLDGSRLGVASYIHPDMRSASTAASGATDVLQLIDMHRFAIGESKSDEPWLGKSSEILAELQGNLGIATLAKTYSIRSFARALGMLSTLSNGRVEKAATCTSEGAVTVWKINPPAKEK